MQVHVKYVTDNGSHTLNYLPYQNVTKLFTCNIAARVMHTSALIIFIVYLL